MIKLVKIISWMFAVGSIALLGGAFYIYSVLVPGLPSIEHLEDVQLQVPLRIYDKNEVLLAEYGEYRRIPVTYNEVPRYVIDAFVSAEDDQYWNHIGVDPVALFAATYELLTTGNKTRGGSTITMQVARNFFLSSAKTYTRKLNEILLALKIESELGKEKILELYVNKIYLGHRAYGLASAAQVYYDKTLKDLTVAQAAMIAGLPKAPSKYNPIINPERALIRRDHILKRMHALGYITDDQYGIARVEPVTAELHATETIADAQYVAELIRAELFEKYGEDAYKNGLNVYTTIDGELQNIANQALRRNLLDYNRRHGYRGVIGNIDLNSIQSDPFDEDIVIDDRVGGLRKGVVLAVSDTAATVLLSDYEQVELAFEGGADWAAKYIDVNKQGVKPKAMVDVLSPGDVIWVEMRAGAWLLADIPQVEGALVSLDSSDGSILSMVGGFDYFKSKFNRVTQAKRQPGSNFKPFIYSAALENGFTAASIINDAPVVFDDDSLEATWRPENYSGKVYGPTRMREALVKSRNLVSIRLLRAIGLRYATDYALRFGFNPDDLPYDLSMALGSGAFSPLEIARAYAVFSNGGFLITPYLISRIETGNGEVIVENKPLRVCQGCEPVLAEEEKSELVVEPVANEAGEAVEVTAPLDAQFAPRVISAQNAYIMRSMMKEVVRRGTAVRAKALGRNDIGGKTGTTNDQVDAWFSGFNNKIVTTAWAGFDNQQTMGSGETGGRAALPMWIDFMRAALDGWPESIEEQPDGLVTVRIDAATGKRAEPGTANSRFEVFRVELAPEEQKVVKSSSGTAPQPGRTTQETEEEMVEAIF